MRSPSSANADLHYPDSFDEHDYSYEVDEDIENDEDSEILEPAYMSISDSSKITHASIVKGHGNDLLKDGRITASIASYTDAIELLNTIESVSESYPESQSLKAILYSNRAAAHIKNNNYKEAYLDCDLCLAIDSTNSKAHFRRATCLCRIGDVAAAKRVLLAMSIKFPQDRSISLLQQGVDELSTKVSAVHSALAEGDASAASKLLDEVDARVAPPSCLALHILRSRILLASGEVSRAQKLLSALYMQPEHKGNMEVALWRGVVLYFNGQQDLALRHFTEVLRQDPDNAEARRYLKLVRGLESKKEEANGLFKRGDTTAAIAAYTACLALDARNHAYNATIHSNRAAAHMKLNDHHLAAADCTESLRLVPNVAKVMARRGRIWLAMGQYQDAIRDLKRAEQLDPSLDVDEDVSKAKTLEKRSKQTSLYTTLGVRVSATGDEIKKAYRKLAMMWHPDKHQGDTVAKAEATFKRITEAYEVLGDADKKRKYDMGMELEDINSGAPQRGFSRGGGGGFGGFGGFQRRSARGFGF